MEPEVEKVMKKRFNLNGEPEYLLKWKGCSHRENTYKPIRHLNCPDLVSAFEKKRKCVVLGELIDIQTIAFFSLYKIDRMCVVHSHSGAKRQNAEFFFLILFADLNRTEEILATQAGVHWPQSVIHFYEQRLEWIPAVHFDAIPMVESSEIDENDYPVAVLYVTTVRGKLMLWMQFPPKTDDRPCKFVPAKEANKKYPELVIEYYERRVSFD